jgi:hypothetical protein
VLWERAPPLVQAMRIIAQVFLQDCFQIGRYPNVTTATSLYEAPVRNKVRGTRYSVLNSRAPAFITPAAIIACAA